jgi:hypothetical protein
MQKFAPLMPKGYSNFVTQQNGEILLIRLGLMR